MLFFKCAQRLPFCFTYLTFVGIKYGDDVVLKTHYFRRFCDLSLFIEYSVFDIYIYSYLYLQHSARYLEHLYFLLKKYSSIRLQVPCCCNHQVYVIYDLKITKNNGLYFINTKISFHVYVIKYSISNFSIFVKKRI